MGQRFRPGAAIRPVMTINSINVRGGTKFLQCGPFFVCVGRKAVDGYDHGHTKLTNIMDMASQVDESLAYGIGIRFI